ncbi:RPA-interacting protein, N-terminal domain [Dillenia turbinata]|uniref:RPA-interacting protein, N-terminal domain n=1 Tax=Dillenia turbinata TaxID=194707 RepID=A0AAN8W725_9MAGN
MEDQNCRSTSSNLNRPSIKSHNSNWKHKLRERCFKRVREDRSRLLWKMRLPAVSQSQPSNPKDFIRSAFKDIVSDELKRIESFCLDKNLEIASCGPKVDDILWEYDGLHTAYEGECEEILLEMQRLFYEGLEEESAKVAFPDIIPDDSTLCIHLFQSGAPENFVETWEDEEDEYLARAVYEHMDLNSEQVQKQIWCPICVHGELQENNHAIYCNLCKLQISRGNEVNLKFLEARLAEAHAEHLDRGCKMKPVFYIKTMFHLTALFIHCQHCNTYEVVI